METQLANVPAHTVLLQHVQTSLAPLNELTRPGDLKPLIDGIAAIPEALQQLDKKQLAAEHLFARGLQEEAVASSLAYIREHAAVAEYIPNRGMLLQKTLEQVDPQLGLLMEFGVYKAVTINQIARRFETHTVHGFDSFEGLPELWSGHDPKAVFDKGSFKLDTLPAVAKNVKLYKGWFTDTLPDFVHKETSPVAFLHIDSDLYSSAKTIFDHLGDRIVADTIILFDEYFGYRKWQQGEHQAFMEFLSAAHLDFIPLYYRETQYAVRMTAKKKR